MEEDKYQEALNDISVDYDGLLKFWKSSVPSYEYEELNKQVNENISTLQELINRNDLLDKALEYLLDYLDGKELSNGEYSRYLKKENLIEDISRYVSGLESEEE